MSRRRICLPAALGLVGLAACASTMAEVDGRQTAGGPSCYGMTSLPWEQPQIGLTSVRVGGAERQIPGLFPSATKDPDVNPAVADQAALDFQCPASSVHVAKRPTADFAWGVEACGHRSAYVAVERDVTTSGAPGHEGRCLVMETVRFVRLEGDAAEVAIHRMDETYSGPLPAAGSQERVFGSAENISRVRNWGALVDQASKDLLLPTRGGRAGLLGPRADNDPCRRRVWPAGDVPAGSQPAFHGAVARPGGAAVIREHRKVRGRYHRSSTAPGVTVPLDAPRAE